MKIIEMTATFGALHRATLRPGPGLTLIQAGNESGKSTWCAFVRAMLYGFPSRDRDREGHLAEKTRYQPWSGAPMEGSMTVEWQGRQLTLRRGPKGAAAWGAFSAVWTATEEPVPGMTGENCGELLLGIPREVFERTAFVGQGETALSASAELEKRVAALATSGEEEVSYSQVERRLKDWLNRRRSNARNGLIPELEGALAQVDQALERQRDTLAQALAAQQQKESLEAEKAALETKLRAHAAAAQRLQLQRREQAQAEYDSALERWTAAQAAARDLPPAETLHQAQGDLRYLNTVAANLRMAEKAIPPAAERANAAQAEVELERCFAGLDPAQAAAQAQRDAEEAKTRRGRLSLLALLTDLGLTVLALMLAWPLVFRPELGLPAPVGAAILCAIAAVGVLCAVLPLTRRKKGASGLLERYGAEAPDDIPQKAAVYAQKYTAALQARQELEAAQRERDKLAAQHQELTGQLLELVHPFAPEVTDLFGVSAALSRALGQGERLVQARAQLDAAQKLLSALPSPQSGTAPAPAPAPLPGEDPQTLQQRLAQVNAQLRQVSDDAARLTGMLSSLGDNAELSQRREALLEELRQRREEYAAIAAAMESLSAADSLLRERFSPAVNQKTGEYLAALTGGRYSGAALTRQFQAAARPAGEDLPRSGLSLSAGAAQQLYLAARLAMCELALPGDDPCPILLDDVLDAFDDRRAALAMECFLTLAGQRQVLLFSCHSRDRALLEGRGAAFAQI